MYVSFVAVKQTLDDVEEVKKILSPYVDEIIVMNANGRGGSICDNMDDLYVADDEYSFTFPCSQLFNNVYITAEGYMIICCQDFENLTVVADLHEESVVSAWTNEKFTHFRERYLRHELTGTLCQNCLNGTAEPVIPLTAEKSGYEVSRQKQKDMLERIHQLITSN